ncbi:3-oxoacyl-[acyl-carrier protein] reductase [Tamaricihabitans halophyticus]|uniref:3-oxoacyl-[acyl-carrier protein] reductase n=1 Tax=Tamaricihabitans halophyticus TaxID=1262583 RepID=A0A4R2QMC6_9PSEU|nr:SDR family oxidoreductase [Tamaricihabitans halophyticus]TCP50029.1 3-oxoacyl-[acyl-carrier protein] reductase [Tamaricihabitans halophyticus]
MDLGLTSRTALVLGSTSGLGYATASGLAAEGARVAFTGRRAELARQRAADHPGALGVGIDLTDPDGTGEAIASITERLGRIDILVLNSGGPPPGTAAELTRQDAAAAVETLLLAQIELVHQLLPPMREAGWGRIVAIGSSGVRQPIAGLVRSNLARAGLAGYLKTLAGEVAADGVTVNMVLPGRVETDRTAQLDEAKASAANTDATSVRQSSEAAIPAKRYGTPAEFAAATVFLCGTGAAYINGVQLRVDGGLVGSF